jgi:predicted aminopeptidase
MASLVSIGVAALAAATLCLTSGCSTVGYYWQSVSGHLGLVNSARPVDEWLADPETPEALKARLALTQRMRDYAVSELKLPDNASYRRFADIQRPAAVWNVVAAPELSLALHTWCFPVVGCVGYRGYYTRESAEAEACLPTPIPPPCAAWDSK